MDADSWMDQDAEDGWTSLDEGGIRADERLKVLRQIRNAASDMDRNPANDPVLWGYGARQIVSMITKRVAEQREAMGIVVRKSGQTDG
jgi:hypothetical protein